MTDSSAKWSGGELVRHRREREARVPDQRAFDCPERTIADLVADVVATSKVTPGTLDIRAHPAARGHRWRTTDAVVGHPGRQYVAASQPPRLPST